VPNDRSGDVLRFRQLFLGFRFGVAQPSNIEVVVSRFDVVAREAAPPPFLALIFPLSAAIRIVAIGSLEFHKVRNGQ
jgi:hypothetical protein